MPPNKERLYIGLYARGTPNSYHWAFLVTPKQETGSPNETVRYHVANRPAMRDGTIKDTWSFEKGELTSLKAQMLLVRVLIAKIERSRNEFETSLNRVLVVQDDSGWRCRSWVKDALAQLAHDGILGTAVVDWVTAERECFAYINRKKAEGRFRKVPAPQDVPTYDLIEGKEITP